MFDVKHLYSKKNCDINGATSGSKYTKSNFSKFYFSTSIFVGKNLNHIVGIISLIVNLYKIFEDLVPLDIHFRKTKCLVMMSMKPYT